MPWKHFDFSLLIFLGMVTNSCGKLDIPAVSNEVNTAMVIRHLRFLTGLPQPRNFLNQNMLDSCVVYIKSEFKSYGLAAEEQEFDAEGKLYKNVIARIGKGPKVVVGAHYDVCGDQPGADDNASAVAGLLETARIIAMEKDKLQHEIEFVAYANEEPPFYKTQYMGSYVHARSLYDKGEKVQVMVCLEMLGYFSEEKKSQDYPLGILKLFYPGKGNFIAAVSNFSSRKYITLYKKVMEQASWLPCETLAAPAARVTGMDFSDHWSYRQFGYKALMITDTSFLRNPHYHEKTDTIGTLDLKRMKEVVRGVVLFLLVV